MVSILVGSKWHYMVRRGIFFLFLKNYFSFPLIKPLEVLNLSLCGMRKLYRWLSPSFQAFVEHELVSCLVPLKGLKHFCLVGVCLVGVEGWGVFVGFLLHS